MVKINNGATHELKTWPRFFKDVEMGLKTFEIRKDDRGFEVDDYLNLREWDPGAGTYTGKKLRVRVTYIVRPDVALVASMLQPGHCVLGIEVQR